MVAGRWAGQGLHADKREEEQDMKNRVRKGIMWWKARRSDGWPLRMMMSHEDLMESHKEVLESHEDVMESLITVRPQLLGPHSSLWPCGFPEHTAPNQLCGDAATQTHPEDESPVPTCI